jgi:hypothetical protein
MPFVHSFLPCRRIRTLSFASECCCSRLQWRQTTEEHCTQVSNSTTVICLNFEGSRRWSVRSTSTADLKKVYHGMGWERPKAEDEKDVRWMASNGSFGYAKAAKCQCPLTEYIYVLRIYLSIYLSLLLTPSMVKRFLKLWNNFNLTESIEERVKVYDPNLVSLD